MPSSMTGFGRYEYIEGTKKIIVEIKSVNHRYLDITLKLSKWITALDRSIRDRIKESVGRGKVDIYVHYEEAADDNFEIRYNPEIAGSYVKNMQQMAKDIAQTTGVTLTDDMTLMKLAAMPDVFELVPVKKNEDVLWEDVKKCLDQALMHFSESRRIEGEKLKADLLDKMHTMQTYVDQIEEKSPQIVEEYRARLLARIEESFASKQIDESRLATEVVLYADKICVDEEIVRLQSHIKEVIRTLDSDEAVGRKLDFLAQEMNREANTILSKSTNAAVAEVGISLKTLVEKVREQIQNLE